MRSDLERPDEACQPLEVSEVKGAFIAAVKGTSRPSEQLGTTPPGFTGQ